MTETTNLSGVRNETLADINAALDDLDLAMSSTEEIIEEIEEITEGAIEEVIEASAEETADDEALNAAIEEATAEIENEVQVVEGVPKQDAIDDLVLAELTESDLQAIEAKAAREEIYSTQESDITTVETTAFAKAPKKASAEPKEKKERKSAAASPRAPKDIATIDPAHFVLEADAAPADQAAAEQLRANVIALRPNQVKIAEKFDNVFGALSVNKAPSVYVMAAFETLDAKGSMTSTEIAGTFKAKGHTDGTANSQSGQIMALFDVLKIATRTKNTLTLNPKSAIAAKLRAMIADKTTGA